MCKVKQCRPGMLALLITLPSPELVWTERISGAADRSLMLGIEIVALLFDLFGHLSRYSQYCV